MLTCNKNGFKLTRKLSPDEGLQVQEDVLSYAHFQLIRRKISFKKKIKKLKFSMSFILQAQMKIRNVAGNMNTTYVLVQKTKE